MIQILKLADEGFEITSSNISNKLRLRGKIDRGEEFHQKIGFITKNQVDALELQNITSKKKSLNNTD